MIQSPTSPEVEWLRREQLHHRLRDEQRFGSALRLLLLAIVLFVWLLRQSEPALRFFPLWLVALALTGLIWSRLRDEEALDEAELVRWTTLGFLLDVAFVVGALLIDGSPRSELYILFVLPLFKVVFLYGNHRVGQLLPLLFVPLYAIVTVVLAGTVSYLAEPFALYRLALLLVVAVPAAFVGRALGTAREQVRYLSLRLAQRKTELDTRTQVLTQTATNLANRVLELRSLQEGIKAINASLDLDELLELIIENASEVFGGATCAIGLTQAEGPLYIAARSVGRDIALPEGVETLERLAERVIDQRHPLLASSPFAEGERVSALMAVPLVADGEPIGALIAARVGDFPFIPDDQQRLSSFADQAALAVKNSRLYEQVERLYQEVKERSEELEAVLASIGDAVLVTGPEGLVRLTNPVANVILGLPDELLDEISLPENLLRHGFEEHLRATLDNQSGDPVLGELTIHSGNLQTDHTYQALSAPLRDPDGRPRGTVTVLRDVTASKQLEQLKNNFVGTVSHELKTPLHSIKGFVDIILSERSTGTLTELQRDFLKTVRDQTHRLERMILDLLEFSRLESGQIRLNPEPLNLRAMSERVAEQLRSVADEASVTLRTTIAGDLPVEGDRLRIEQVLNNLIANAIKFTEPGGEVTVHGSLDERMSHISVHDTGIGIPVPERERIFERFYQVDASQTRKYGGTGLGLAICKHIIERHGGRIWVESVEGQGSTFHFTLPRELGNTTPLSVDFSRLESTRELESRGPAALG